jgi:hypothetical protein
VRRFSKITPSSILPGTPLLSIVMGMGTARPLALEAQSEQYGRLGMTNDNTDPQDDAKTHRAWLSGAWWGRNRARLPQKRAGDDKPGKSHARGFEMQNHALKCGHASATAPTRPARVADCCVQSIRSTSYRQDPPDHTLVYNSWCRSYWPN